MPKLERESRAYFTLAICERGVWSPQFGDYERAVVEAERVDMLEGNRARGSLKARDVKIVKSAPDNDAIDQAIAKLNRETQSAPIKWMVMSAVTLTDANMSRATSFDRNAVDIATEAEAEIEAARRNAVEREAGHTNVDWYACEMFDLPNYLAGRV